MDRRHRGLPIRPKRPKNSFLLWYHDNRARLTQQNPHANRVQHTLLSIAALEWRALTDEQKSPYRHRFEEERRRYRQLRDAYRLEMKTVAPDTPK